MKLSFRRPIWIKWDARCEPSIHSAPLTHSYPPTLFMSTCSVYAAKCMTALVCASHLQLGLVQKQLPEDRSVVSCSQSHFLQVQMLGQWHLLHLIANIELIFVVFVHSDIAESFLDTMHKTGGARLCFAFKFLLILLYLLTLGCDFTNGFLCLAEMKIANSKDR